MKVFIKNMVSERCIIFVKEELSRLSLHYSSVELGIAVIVEDISVLEYNLFKAVLLKSGLELIEDKKALLVQRIKMVISEFVNENGEQPVLKFSALLSQELGCNYTYLAGVFSEVQGTTIEKFISTFKIDRVKELLHDRKFNLSEIAYRMCYSSVAHLSAQFKKVTGYSPTSYCQMHFGATINKGGPDKNPALC